MGSLTSARASATRCCWPPDIWLGLRFSRGRLVLSAAPEHRDAVGAFLGDHGRRIGEVTAGDDIVFHLLDPAEGDYSRLTPIRIPLADAVSASTHGPSGPTRGATA